MTTKQAVAYRELRAKRLQAAQIAAYGMVPIRAKYAGHCPCGQARPRPYGRGQQACPYGQGDHIVKFRGAWWNAACVDRVRQEEFRGTAKYVLVEVTRRRDGSERVWEKAWTNDTAEAERWRRRAAELKDAGWEADEESVIER